MTLSRWPGIISVALLAVGAAGCTQVDTRAPDTTQAQELALELPLDLLSGIVVPEEDGPQLAALAMHVPVLARPEPGATRVGYLRLGARVARSTEPVSREDCQAGWFALRPVGFICADDKVTTDMAHPLAEAIQREPDRSRPLPYPYAFLRAIAPNYLRIPSVAEQEKREMRLGRHLRNWKKLRDEWDKAVVGSNDVPLRSDGQAEGAPPTSPTEASLLERLGGQESAAPPAWLASGKRQVPNVSGFEAPSYAVMAGRIKRHAGVALIDAFGTGERAGERAFALTTDARLLPADKLKVEVGSTYHGQDIRDIGLPVAFGNKAGASWWHYENGRLSRAKPLVEREFIALTGKVRRIGGSKMVQAQGGLWLRSVDIKTAPKPRKLPWFASGKRRWIHLSLLNQTMVLWEGARPVYATLVSTGRDGMADPKTTLSTPQGTFRIYAKHVTTTMDSNVADKEFELRDVPWVMYFKGGYALHAAYWHDDFGRPRSHGCVNLAPIDARHVFEWSSPDVPAHWHGSEAGETFAKGTLIQIQP